ncbi:MAG TPA: type III pantothenate kinase [Nitriliruptorales bacterium]|nr:type III pantothenate kinase [Nitriliruptorales bacterium]
MLLAVDIGNSQTVLGVFEGAELVQHWRLSSETMRTSDEVALIFQGLLAFADLSFPRDLHGIVIASVVPTVTEALRDMVDRYLEFPPVVVEPGTRTGVAIRTDNPREVGADRIVNAVAAHELYGGPAVVVDFGTATSFDAVSRDGTFIGGAIAPGIQTSVDALVSRTARLPKVEIVAPKSVIGTSTETSLQSGIVYGFAGQVDAVVERMRDRLGPGVTTVATGGLASAVLEACRTIDHHDPWLTLKGLRIIWERNTG